MSTVAPWILVALLACGTPPPIASNAGGGAAEAGDGWPVATLETAGIRRDWIDALELAVRTGREPRPDALVIARKGALVYEQYWNGRSRDALHDLRSATKSITSLLTGIAVDRGVLANLDEPAFPGVPALAAITVHHLLAMQSGLACDDWDPRSPGQEDKMYEVADWVAFVTALPVTAPAGTRTAYCTGGVVVIGAVLEAHAHQPIPALSRAWLFEPLGITRFAWQPAGRRGTDTGGHLQLTARDFAKIGQLVANRGVWRDRRVISEAYLAEATRDRGKLGDSGYGLLWWTNTFSVRGTPVPVTFARGNGGQMLFIAPSLDLVVAVQGSHYNRPATDSPIALFGRYILPAVLGLERPAS
jgi:CubicO group peptidase (beta-lactamase class C family)